MLHVLPDHWDQRGFHIFKGTTAFRSKHGPLFLAHSQSRVVAVHMEMSLHSGIGPDRPSLVGGVAMTEHGQSPPGSRKLIV